VRTVPGSARAHYLEAIDRRRFLGTVTVGVLVAPRVVAAEPATRIPRVGVLHTRPNPAEAQAVLALRKGLRELGYIEGQTVVLDYRSAAEKVEALPGLLSELVTRPVDLLFVVGPASLLVVHQTAVALPVVAVDLESDPVQAGFARSLGRPGGNITGLFMDLPALTGKWLELIRETVPTVRQVGVLWDASTGLWQVAAARSAAERLAIDVQLLKVRGPDDLDKVFRTASTSGARALIQLSAPLISTHSRRIADLTAKHRLPAISPFRLFVEAGGLMAYGPDLVEFFRRAATYVDKILKGAKPGDLPIEQPTKFEFVINLKTAKALGLTIPPSLLLRADQVIE
jgi:putative ABC transport system substrate-binding protein